MLYPLKFKPIQKERIWGGTKLRSLYGKDFPLSKKIGESWEISCIEEDVSIVSNGFLKGNKLDELIEIYMGDLVGEQIYEEFGNTFPLLIKFLDANEDLSIQLHPTDELAVSRHNCYGKAEFWYMLESDKNAKLIHGFSKLVSKEEYLKHLQHNTLEEIVEWSDVKKGDVFFVPAGKIHAIGKGNTVLEVQQTSDITYRIFDYNRTDDEGNKRELHTEQALDAIDFESFDKNPIITFENKKNNLNKVHHCDFFCTNYINFDEVIFRDYYKLDSFVIYVCLSGKCKIYYNNESEIETLKKGETVLIPAELNEIKLVPDELTEIMEVYIAKQTSININEHQ